MKEGRKIYSLLLKSIDNNYYQLKIGDDYRHALAIIDAYTMQFDKKKYLCEGRSKELEVPILDAKIVYQKQGKTKIIEPVFSDNEELKSLIKWFGSSSAIDTSDYPRVTPIQLFAQKLMQEYQMDASIKSGFDKYGDFIVRESLQKNDIVALVFRLCEYRKLRQTIILKRQIKQGKITNVLPVIVSLNGVNIIKSDTRRLEQIEREIGLLQSQNITDDVLAKVQSLRLAKLYTKREELISSLDIKEDKNQIPGQTRIMF